MKKIYFLFFYLFSMYHSYAQTIRAVFFNPPGTDATQEYIEISAAPSTALTNLWFIEVDGDAGSAGNINTAIPLGTYSTGSNGLLLIRDNALVLSPAPDAATNVVVLNFTPDIQNGTGTFLIVSGFTGAVGSDLDTDNDGTLNSTPWTSVLSAVSVTDGTANDDQYADDVGGTNLPDIATFGAEGVVLYNGNYFAVDVSGTSPGPYEVDAAWDATGTRSTFVETKQLTPGATLSPLPVTLLSFSGYKDRTVNNLKWVTSTESGNKGFTIQRSADGISYIDIAFIPSQANGGISNGNLTYSFADNVIDRKKYFYRLMQIDLSNASKLSNTIIIDGDKSSVLAIEGLYPNPVSNQLYLNINVPVKQKLNIVVSDIAGRNVSTQLVAAEAGNNTFSISVQSLTSGYYLVKVMDDNGSVQSQKFVKQ